MPTFPKVNTKSKYLEDDNYFYKNVYLSKEVYSKIPKRKLLSGELLQYNVIKDSAWEHYILLRKEPHIIPLRKKKPQDLKDMMGQGKKNFWQN